jgi:hypothetical protein
MAPHVDVRNKIQQDPAQPQPLEQAMGLKISILEPWGIPMAPHVDDHSRIQQDPAQPQLWEQALGLKISILEPLGDPHGASC